MIMFAMPANHLKKIITHETNDTLELKKQGDFYTTLS